jgi:hypothetical protein
MLEELPDRLVAPQRRQLGEGRGAERERMAAAVVVAASTPGWSPSSRTSTALRGSIAATAAATEEEQPAPKCGFSTTSTPRRSTLARTASALPPTAHRSWSKPHARAVARVWSSSVRSP